MTPDQFKAWFEGFCEGVNDAPTPDQWEKVKAKVAHLREKPPVTLREPDNFRRQWIENNLPDNRPLVARGIPTAGDHVGRIAYGADAGSPIPVSYETRVIDALTGADLGPSD